MRTNGNTGDAPWYYRFSYPLLLKKPPSKAIQTLAIREFQSSLKIAVLHQLRKLEPTKKRYFQRKSPPLSVIQMSKYPPVTFRVPSKYLVFLEMLARENKTNRSQELWKIFDDAIARYLERNSKPPREKK